MIENKEINEKINALLSSYPSLKIAYLFGSRAQGKAGIMSDYDFAIYLDEQNVKKNYEIKFELISKLGLLLKSNEIDVVLLNLTDAPELKYNIIKEGKIIFERDDFRIVAEPEILNEYFDFHTMLKRHNLTKA